MFAGTHCLANTQGDRLKLFHAWDNLPAWLRALTDPVGLIPPRATKTGLSPNPTTQYINQLFVSVRHEPTTSSPYAALSNLPESQLHSFPDDLPTSHLVSHILILQYSWKKRHPTGVLLGTVWNTSTHGARVCACDKDESVTARKQAIEKQQVEGWIVAEHNSEFWTLICTA